MHRFVTLEPSRQPGRRGQQSGASGADRQPRVSGVERRVSRAECSARVFRVRLTKLQHQPLAATARLTNPRLGMQGTTIAHARFPSMSLCVIAESQPTVRPSTWLHLRSCTHSNHDPTSRLFQSQRWMMRTSLTSLFRSEVGRSSLCQHKLRLLLPHGKTTRTSPHPHPPASFVYPPRPRHTWTSDHTRVTMYSTEHTYLPRLISPALGSTVSMETGWSCRTTDISQSNHTHCLGRSG